MHRRAVTGIVAVAAALGVCVALPLGVLAGIPLFDIAVSKSHTGNFTVGKNGTFTVTLSMSTIGFGLSSIANDTFRVTDSLPSGLAYVTAGGPSFTCTNTGSVVHCTGAPTMTKSQTQTITVVVSAGSAASPSVTNHVTYTDSIGADTNTTNNVATDVVAVQAASTSPSPSATSSSRTSTTSTIAAPPTGAASGGGAMWIVAVLAVALGAFLTIAGVRRRA